VRTIRTVLLGLLATLAAGLLAGCTSAAPAAGPRASGSTMPVLAAPSATASTTAAGATRKRALTPEPTPCARNRQAKYVLVDLHAQHMWMCAARRVARDTAITTGMLGQYTETPTGTFRIQGRNRRTVLTLADGEQYEVNYWIPFQAPLFGFHDSSWQKFPYGSPEYKTDGSHGCIHLPLAAIRFLYDWADIGTTVRVRA
jgi:lipoprotein-anchoring transpeptidase ErfK/SrfK